MIDLDKIREFLDELIARAEAETDRCGPTGAHVEITRAEVAIAVKAMLDALQPTGWETVHAEDTGRSGPVVTCVDHVSPVEDCCGCAGRWDRAMAERARAGLYGREAAALRMAVAEIDRLIRIGAQRLAQNERMCREIERLDVQRDADLAEATATYEAMRAEIEALRCGDLVAFIDGELPLDRADAFREHLGRCEDCQQGLQDDVPITAALSEMAVQREPR